MARGLGGDDPDPGPSRPPILGTDNTPWMTAEQIQAALNPPASPDDRGAGGGSPGPINMNINQFLGLDRPTQNQILATWGKRRTVANWDYRTARRALESIGAERGEALPDGLRPRVVIKEIAGPRVPLDRVAQMADRKYCRPHARPFRLGFPRKVSVFPICPPAAL